MGVVVVTVSLNCEGVVRCGSGCDYSVIDL